jgi:hypothetical protein
MVVTIFEDLVLRERRDALLEVAVPQRQQRALVVEECDARGQGRHLSLFSHKSSREVVRFRPSMPKIHQAP